MCLTVSSLRLHRWMMRRNSEQMELFLVASDSAASALVQQHARNKDHARACKNGQHKLSAFVEHYDQYHTVEGVRQPLQIETQLLATGLAYCKRCITEAIEVADRNPALNRNQPCVQLRSYILT